MAALLRKGRDRNTRFSETFGMGTYARSRAKQRSGPEGLESGPWRRDPVVAPCQRVAGWKCPVEGGAAGPEELRPCGLAPCASVTSGPEWLRGVCVVCVVLFLSQFSFPLPHVRHHHVLRSTKKRRFAPPPPQAALPDCLVPLGWRMQPCQPSDLGNTCLVLQQCHGGRGRCASVRSPGRGLWCLSISYAITGASFEIIKLLRKKGLLNVEK